MNNSEPLTPHEEKLTTYFDGCLSATEAAAFEREHPEVLAEKTSTARLGDVLRAHSVAPAMHHADFFNHQILREIAPAPAPARRAAWPLWRLAFASACCLFAVLGIYQTFVKNSAPPRHFAQVLSVTAGDPGLTAEVIDGDGISVVWVDGLDYLSKDYVLE